MPENRDFLTIYIWGVSYIETKNRDLWKVYGLSETWSFHDTDVEDSGLLGCYVGWQGY